MYKMNSFDIPDGYLPDGIQISCNEGIETGEIFVRARYSFVSHGIVKFDIVLAQAPRNGIMSPVVGPDGKNVIERHPLRCWHGIGHEGKHGYGHITWTDKKET